MVQRTKAREDMASKVQGKEKSNEFILSRSLPPPSQWRKEQGRKEYSFVKDWFRILHILDFNWARKSAKYMR